jgi:hypothetical protein
VARDQLPVRTSQVKKVRDKAKPRMGQEPFFVKEQQRRLRKIGRNFIRQMGRSQLR